MRNMMRGSMLAAFLAALALATGCEDTPLFAGKDFRMTLTAEPGLPDTDGKPRWDIVAIVVNDTSIPQQGITVFFSTTNGGTLVPGAAGVSTHSDGRAAAKLTVEPGSPASITVTATSAALSKTVTITTTGTGLCDINTPPTAAISPSADFALPPKGAGANTTVSTPSLSGTSSTDLQTPSASLVYSWDCGGGTAPSLTDDHVICTYTYQTADTPYVITLTVTDRGLVGHESECEQTASTSLTVTVPGTSP